MKKPKTNEIKILLLDIETSPIVSYTWGLWDQNVGLNQIKQDWHLLSVSFKWYGEKQVYYMDQRKSKNIEDDRKLAEFAHKMISQADVLVTQNGIAFDMKKLNTRFIIHGFDPVGEIKHIDTLKIARKHFAFTSNKLEFLSKNLSPGTEKLKVHKFIGFDLWKECLKGNPKAWREMERYNKQDVIALEAVYNRLKQWDKGLDFSKALEAKTGFKHDMTCDCGCQEFVKNGLMYSHKMGPRQRWSCKDCGRNYYSKIGDKNVKESNTVRNKYPTKKKGKK